MRRVEVEIRPDGFGFLDVEYTEYVSDVLVANAEAIRAALRIARVPLCTNGAVIDIKTGKLLVHESILNLIGFVYLVYPDQPPRLSISVEVELELRLEL